MVSKLTAVIVVLGVLVLAGNAHAFKGKGVVLNKGTAVSMGGSLSFDGSLVDIATLNTYAGTVNFPTNPALSGPFRGQSISEYSVGKTACNFTGVFGEKETGVSLSLVGLLAATDGASGSIFFAGIPEDTSGCISEATGAYTITEVDVIFAGVGVFKGAIGNVAYTNTGFTLGPPVAAGALGFFQWGKAKGIMTIKTP